MKIRKILAGMSAAAIAASMLSVSAFAADQNGNLDVGTMAPFKMHSGESEGVKIIQLKWDVLLEGIDEDATLTAIDISMYAEGAPAAQAADGWSGGGGDFGLDFAANDDGNLWYQTDLGVDTPADGTTDWTRHYDIPAEADTFILPGETDKTTLDSKVAQNLSATEDGMLQLGWWWGNGYDPIEVKSLTLTFSDGTVLKLVDEDGKFETYDDYAKAVEKAAREKAAADALAKLEEAVDAASFDEVIAEMNAAADALNNATEVIAKADAAKKEIEDLKAVLDEATEAFEALQDGDEADKDAYEAAKAKVEEAAANLAAAQEAFENAQKAYDEETAKQLAAKDQEIADLEDEVEDLKAQLAAAPTAEEKAALEAQIAEKEAKIAELEKSVADLEKALKDAQKAAPTTDDSKPDTKTDDTKTDDKGSNPNTGTGALATVGVALAAAAFVVSKKRK